VNEEGRPAKGFTLNLKEFSHHRPKPGMILPFPYRINALRERAGADYILHLGVIFAGSTPSPPQGNMTPIIFSDEARDL
jgi:hypothetical protein